MSPSTQLQRNAAAYAPPAELAELQRRALVVGGAAAIPSLIGAFVDPAAFFHSYLVAFLMCLGVPLGCMSLVFLHHLTGGSWGFVMRRIPEAASRTLPLVALFFVPLVFGLRHLYAWARPEDVALDPLLQHKSAYLNVPFFVGRMLFDFAAWGALAFFLSRWSRQQDEHVDAYRVRRMRGLGAAGLVLYVLTSTFVAFDFLMSLEPHWYSTIYGLYLVGGQVAAALAFIIVMGFWLEQRPPLEGVLAPRHFDDYGKLLLTFLSLWLYFAFSQYLIIWSANLHAEIPWYVVRRQGGWRLLSPALFLLHFAVPFMLLLSRSLRRDPPRLAAVAALVLVMRGVDLYFQAAPAFHPQGIAFHWLDVTVPVALAGLWFAYFVRQLRGRPLLSFNEPHIQDAMGDGGGGHG
jgi:hypothetical protein